MKKAVLISIKPKFCKKIAVGLKLLELRKNRPMIELPFKAYIYCTQGAGKNTYCCPLSNETVRKDYEETGSMKSLTCAIGNGKVIGEFVCDSILGHCEMANADIAEQLSCVRREDILAYGNGKEVFGWHISDLVMYEQPKELSEFKPWNRECKWADLGLAIPNCEDCHDCKVERPPQSWCFVEDLR